MNLRQCEIFRAVMEMGTVTAAAERLHVSQPAVSKILAQFERELGFAAFKRDRRRLVPTPEADALYREVCRAFLGLDYLTRVATDLRDLRQGQLVVAATHVIASHYLPEILAPFLRRYPGLSASLQSLDSPGTAQAVASGRADLGISQFEVATPGVRSEVLCTSEAVCVMPPDHRLAAESCVAASALAGEPFIALAAVNPLRVSVDTLLRETNAIPRTVVDTPLASTACRLVMQGTGIAVMDRLSAEANLHLGVVMRPLLPVVASRLLLLLPEHRPSSGATRAFADATRSRFSSVQEYGSQHDTWTAPS
ncbi:MAG: LysR substrate-binding domain-containing protein [Janthinobacterium lividum]